MLPIRACRLRHYTASRYHITSRYTQRQWMHSQQQQQRKKPLWGKSNNLDDHWTGTDTCIQKNACNPPGMTLKPNGILFQLVLVLLSLATSKFVIFAIVNVTNRNNPSQSMLQMVLGRYVSSLLHDIQACINNDAILGSRGFSITTSYYFTIMGSIQFLDYSRSTSTCWFQAIQFYLWMQSRWNEESRSLCIQELERVFLSWIEGWCSTYCWCTFGKYEQVDIYPFFADNGIIKGISFRWQSTPFWCSAWTRDWTNQGCHLLFGCTFGWRWAIYFSYHWSRFKPSFASLCGWRRVCQCQWYSLFLGWNVGWWIAAQCTSS